MGPNIYLDPFRKFNSGLIWTLKKVLGSGYQYKARLHLYESVTYHYDYKVIAFSLKLDGSKYF